MPAYPLLVAISNCIWRCDDNIHSGTPPLVPPSLLLIQTMREGNLKKRRKSGGGREGGKEKWSKKEKKKETSARARREEGKGKKKKPASLEERADWKRWCVQMGSNTGNGVRRDFWGLSRPFFGDASHSLPLLTSRFISHRFIFPIFTISSPTSTVMPDLPLPPLLVRPRLLVGRYRWFM